MSFNICSISGMTLINPVVSKKSGFVFEKRLIEKHIEATGRCPITKHELSKDDLIEIKNERKINLAQPRSVNLVSIPGMFSELQKEWDSLLLETHLLKKELDVARQELAHSMYQSDASCRVICNLLKEKEFAREELANYKLEFEDADDEGFSGEESDYMGITKELTSRIEEFTYKSIAERKQRKIIDNFAKFQDLKSYELKLRYYPFVGVKSKSLVNTSIGITSSANNNKSNHIVLGTNDGTLGLCELKLESKGYIIENKLILNAHNKKINDVQIYPSNEILGFATGSDDGTCAFYINNSSKDIKISERYRTNNTIHLEAITSISFHPLEEYALISSLDGSWSFHNLIKAVVLHKHFNGNSINCIKFHPDGAIFGSGQVSGMIKLWDITSQKEFSKLQDEKMDSVNSISFSENGFYLASCGVEDTQVRIWDIRKNKIVKNINLQEGNYVNKVEFDSTGNYLTMAGNNVSICDIHSIEIAHKLQAHTNIVTSVRFGDNLDSFFYSTSLDGDINVYTA